jgi:hypothetical protein
MWRLGSVEAKDWFTLATSWVALTIAGYSLWITLQRDRRERAKDEPVFSLDIASHKNAEHSSGHCHLESRQASKLIFEELRLIAPRRARLIRDVAKSIHETVSALPVDVELSMGESTMKHFYIVPKIAAGTKVVFEAVVRTLGRHEGRRRYRIQRTIPGPRQY